MPEQDYISAGGAVKLLCEDHYKEAFDLSTKAFRALCRNLEVPLIHRGTKAYVDMHVFEIAMVSITRIGQPDFHFPASKTTTNHGKKASTIDIETLRRDWRKVVREVVSRRKIAAADVSLDTRRSIRTAAERLAALGNPARAEQGRVDRINAANVDIGE